MIRKRAPKGSALAKTEVMSFRVTDEEADRLERLRRESGYDSYQEMLHGIVMQAADVVLEAR